MIYEYATTTGSTWTKVNVRMLGLDWDEGPPEAPKPPHGDGWELIGTSVSRSTIYWSWRREKP